MLGLAPLPSEQELEAIQEAKRREVQRRIALERQAAAEKEQKRKEDLRKREQQHSRSPSSGGKASWSSGERSPEEGSTSSGKSGWKPIEVATSQQEDDPMIQQMNNIRAYIKQAKAAQKWDEVQMLEQNLKELQHVYWQSHQKS